MSTHLPLGVIPPRHTVKQLTNPCAVVIQIDKFVHTLAWQGQIELQSVVLEVGLNACNDVGREPVHQLRQFNLERIVAVVPVIGVYVSNYLLNISRQRIEPIDCFVQNFLIRCQGAIRRAIRRDITHPLRGYVRDETHKVAVGVYLFLKHRSLRQVNQVRDLVELIYELTVVTQDFSVLTCLLGELHHLLRGVVGFSFYQVVQGTECRCVLLK